MRISIPRLLLAVAAITIFSMPALAGRKLVLSKGQTVYVPVYSHIYQGIKGQPYNLSGLLSIRNVDATHSITINSVNYYGDDGLLVKKFLNSPLVVNPMATTEMYIPERDNTGGSGANFTVKWTGAENMSVPVIQAVMIGTASTLGISFVCDGVVIEED